MGPNEVDTANPNTHEVYEHHGPNARSCVGSAIYPLGGAFRACLPLGLGVPGYLLAGFDLAGECGVAE